MSHLALFPAETALLGGGDPALVQQLMQALPGELFFHVVEQSSVAISITDPEAHIIYSNQAFSRLTGFSRSELKGRNHNVLASQQTPRSRYQAMWSTLESRRSWSGRLINKRKDGSLYLAEVTVTPVLDSAGHISHFLGMHKDISERHALDQRLQNQMALLEAVLNAAPMAVAVLDDNEQILLDNLAYKTLRSDLSGGEPAARLQQVEPMSRQRVCFCLCGFASRPTGSRCPAYRSKASAKRPVTILVMDGAPSVCC